MKLSVSPGAISPVIEIITRPSLPATVLMSADQPLIGKKAETASTRPALQNAMIFVTARRPHGRNQMFRNLEAYARKFPTRGNFQISKSVGSWLRSLIPIAIDGLRKKMAASQRQ